MKFQVITEIEISPEAFDLLKKINKAGYAEYRDTEYSCLEDFKRGEEAKHRSAQWFLDRNFDGTLYLTEELMEKELVEFNYDSWHTTYKMSKLGKNLIDQHNSN